MFGLRLVDDQSLIAGSLSYFFIAEWLDLQPCDVSGVYLVIQQFNDLLSDQTGLLILYTPLILGRNCGARFAQLSKAPQLDVKS